MEYLQIIILFFVFIGSMWIIFNDNDNDEIA